VWCGVVWWYGAVVWWSGGAVVWWCGAVVVPWCCGVVTVTCATPCRTALGVLKTGMVISRGGCFTSSFRLLLAKRSQQALKYRGFSFLLDR
jgi:hypothetical protein